MTRTAASAGGACEPVTGSAVKVYLWRAGRWLGVTDTEGQAKAAAAECLADCTTAGAEASVEPAWITPGSVRGDERDYLPTGERWAGRLSGDQVAWTQTRAPKALAA